RVRLRALTVHGQPAPVADAAIAADLLKALDGLLPLTAQVALHLQLRVDVALELRDLGISQVAHLRVGREAERSANLARRRLPDAVDVRQPDLEPLLLRDVDAGDACHLALPLLVAWVGADDHRRAVALDHAAALAHGLD